MDFSQAILRFKALSARLSRAHIVFYLMPALMILLVVGTLAQAEIGLYEAHRTYFASFYFWAGIVPLPGGYTLLGVLTFHLLLKFIFHSDWKRHKSGIILTHFGALILLLGGLFTGLSAREGYMVIAEGDKSPYVYDYHQREMLVFRNDRLLYQIDFHTLRDSITGRGGAVLPLGIKIVDMCDNCAIAHRSETPQDFAAGLELQSMAQFMALLPKPKEKEAEANLSGFSFVLDALDDPAQEGLYIAFEAMPKPVEFTKDGADYKIIYGKSQRQLPFAIGLVDFIKKDYPGTQMAQSYSSDVIVLDQGAQWQARIEMNAPLRYKGYTFYQSSFDQSGEVEMTVLSVVENKGRLFPYIGTLVIMLGLLVHIAFIFKGKKTSARVANGAALDANKVEGA